MQATKHANNGIHPSPTKRTDVLQKLKKQECIPAGCVPPASVAIRGGVCLGGCLPRGRCLPRVGRCLAGGCVYQNDSQTGVKHYLAPNFAGGKSNSSLCMVQQIQFANDLQKTALCTRVLIALELLTVLLMILIQRSLFVEAGRARCIGTCRQKQGQCSYMQTLSSKQFRL